jgi:hypothetical protein
LPDNAGGEFDIVRFEDIDAHLEKRPAVLERFDDPSLTRKNHRLPQIAGTSNVCCGSTCEAASRFGHVRFSVGSGSAGALRSQLLLRIPIVPSLMTWRQGNPSNVNSSHANSLIDVAIDQMP